MSVFFQSHSGGSGPACPPVSWRGDFVTVAARFCAALRLRRTRVWRLLPLIFVVPSRVFVICHVKIWALASGFPEWSNKRMEKTPKINAARASGGRGKSAARRHAAAMLAP
ncbi:MAG: hypothetical protein CM15mP55_3590 [Hyphomicrobiales bacterium]|nr:MAG: hypothetical protein CM15mP55_3590 [Hyphomicrobiales bacterium]